MRLILALMAGAAVGALGALVMGEYAFSGLTVLAAAVVLGLFVAEAALAVHRRSALRGRRGPNGGESAVRGRNADGAGGLGATGDEAGVRHGPNAGEAGGLGANGEPAVGGRNADEAGVGSRKADEAGRSVALASGCTVLAGGAMAWSAWISTGHDLGFLEPEGWVAIAAAAVTAGVRAWWTRPAAGTPPAPAPAE